MINEPQAEDSLGESLRHIDAKLSSSTVSMVMRSPCGDALDLPLWKVPNQALGFASCCCLLLNHNHHHCRTYYKAVRAGGEHGGGHVLYDTTSLGLCGLV